MKQDFSIDAKKRPIGKKNASKKAFRDEKITCVYYSRSENIPITIDRYIFEKQIPKLKSNTVFQLDIDGEKKKAIIQDYNFFLLNRRVSHIDFLGLEKGRAFKLGIPVELKNRAIGVTKGGTLRRFVNKVKVLCKPEDIPDILDIDIKNLDVGDIVYIKDLATQHKNLRFLENPKKPVVAVISSRLLATAEAEAKVEEKEEAGAVESKEKEKTSEKKE